MIYISRNSRRKKKSLKTKIISAVSALLILVIICAFYYLNNVRPMVQSIAIASAKGIATSAIYSSVNSELGDIGVEYSDLVILEKDTSGRLVALTTEVAKINQLKARLSMAVLEELQKDENKVITIPLGSIIGGELFSGKGPEMEYNMIPAGAVEADMVNVFESAGINQTRHQIVIRLTVDFGLILSGYTTESSVTADIAVAETIIVGNVPESYLSLDGEKIYKLTEDK